MEKELRLEDRLLVLELELSLLVTFAAGGLMGLLHLAQAAATEERYPEDRGAAPAVGAGVGVDVGGSRLAGVEGAVGVAPPQKVLEFSHSLPSAASKTVEL